VTEKPTYEELKQKVEELEKEAFECKRAEDSLRESERLYRLLADNVNDIIWTMDMEMKFTYFSPSVNRMLGYSVEEAMAQSIEEYMTPASLDIAVKAITEELELHNKGQKPQDRSRKVEVEIYCKDGSTIWTEIEANFIYDDDSQPQSIIGVARGITERKHAEEALQESEKRFRLLTEFLVDTVYEFDPKGKFTYVNEAGVRMLGYSKDELLGNIQVRDTISKEDYARSKEAIGEIFKGKTIFAERTLIRKDGTTFIGEIHSGPINKGKDVIGVRGVLRDITDRKEMEAHLLQSHKMEAISALAGGIAHQFNNALFAITCNIDLLEMDFPDDEKVANYAKGMKVSTGRMTKLAAQLLAYARDGKYEVKTISLNDFVKETLPLVKYNIDSTINMDTNLPRDILKVKVDLTQMQMVLSAVLTNASEAMEGKGRIQVTCKNELVTDGTTERFPGLKPGNYAYLSITDNGKGMDEETRNRIFEPFFTTKFEGRGLGMAAAYGIVKNHDGWISVDSELGQGTIVKIYLPAVETPVKKDAKPKTEWIKGEGSILVIDDEETVMSVTRAMLEKMGYRVLEAKTGQEAIDIVKTFDGDIVLAMLDIFLPGMGGESIYPLLMKACPNLKVIVFSGYSIDVPAQKILDAGAEDFIQKPFTMTELSNKLKKILENE